MKALRYILPLFIFITFTFSECEDDPKPILPVENNLRLDFSASVGTNDFSVDTEFLNEDSHPTKFETFKFYISRVTLVKADLTEIEVKDVALVDFKSNFSKKVRMNVPSGNYVAIKFGIGLDSVLNASDPATFPQSHPLGISQGTYWSWASQYKFAMFDGRVDTVGNLGSATDVLVSIHPGTNPLYRKIGGLQHTFTTNTTSTEVVNIDVDMFEIFNGDAGKVDITVDNQSHVTPSDKHIATRIMDNFVNAFSIE